MGSAGTHDAQWKHRIGELQKVLEASTHAPSAPGHKKSSSGSLPLHPAAGGGHPPTHPSSHSSTVHGTSVSKETYNKLKNELEMKKDELKIAMRKIEELSGSAKGSAIDSAKRVAAKLKRNFFANRLNKSDVDPNKPIRMTEIPFEELSAMKKEIHELEDLLNSTEEKLDQLTKESKIMKHILQQPQALQMSNHSMLLAPPSPEKAGRRLFPSNTEIVDGNKPSPAAVLQHLMLTSHHHLMDQVLFWRKMALHRHVASLSELPTTRLFRAEEAQRSAEAAAAAKANDISAVKESYGIVSSLARSAGTLAGSKAVRIEVVDKPFQNEVLDRKTLYRDLRRLRADCVRVATIEDDGRDLNRLQKRLAEAPPLPLKAVIQNPGERRHSVEEVAVPRKSLRTHEGEEEGARPPPTRRAKSHTSVLMFRLAQLHPQSLGQ